MWYLKGIIYLELVYGSQFEDKGKTKAPIAPLPFWLIGNGNNSYAGDPKNRKSIIGYYYFINRIIIYWCNKKQRTVLISTIKAKYIAFRYAIREVI